MSLSKITAAVKRSEIAIDSALQNPVVIAFNSKKHVNVSSQPIIQPGAGNQEPNSDQKYDEDSISNPSEPSSYHSEWHQSSYGNVPIRSKSVQHNNNKHSQAMTVNNELEIDSKDNSGSSSLCLRHNPNESGLDEDSTSFRHSDNLQNSNLLRGQSDQSRRAIPANQAPQHGDLRRGPFAYLHQARALQPGQMEEGKNEMAADEAEDNDDDDEVAPLSVAIGDDEAEEEDVPPLSLEGIEDRVDGNDDDDDDELQNDEEGQENAFSLNSYASLPIGSPMSVQSDWSRL